MWGQSNLAGLDDLVEDKVADMQNSGEIKKYSLALEAELKKGAGIDTTFICVVGKKDM